MFTALRRCMPFDVLFRGSTTVDLHVRMKRVYKNCRRCEIMHVKWSIFLTIQSAAMQKSAHGLLCQNGATF